MTIQGKRDQVTADQSNSTEPRTPKGSLIDLPHGVYEGANRYDDDNQHILHLWRDGRSWDVVEPRRDKLPVLDHSYGETPTYDLSGYCLTCGTAFIVRRQKGIGPPLMVKCPTCECTVFSWRDHSELRREPAAQALSAQPDEGLREADRRIMDHALDDAMTTETTAADQWADEIMQAHQLAMPDGLSHSTLVVEWFARAVELHDAEVDGWAEREGLDEKVRAWRQEKDDEIRAEAAAQALSAPPDEGGDIAEQETRYRVLASEAQPDEGLREAIQAVADAALAWSRSNMPERAKLDFVLRGKCAEYDRALAANERQTDDH